MQLLELQGVTRYWPVLDPDLYFLLGIYSCAGPWIVCLELWTCVGPWPVFFQGYGPVLDPLLQASSLATASQGSSGSIIQFFVLHCLTLLLILFHWLKSKTLIASSDLPDLNTLRWILHYFFSLHTNYLWPDPSEGLHRRSLKLLMFFLVPAIK